MASPKKKPKPKKTKKPELNPFGKPYPSYPPATQGRQGDWMDKILKDTYGWQKCLQESTNHTMDLTPQ